MNDQNPHTSNHAVSGNQPVTLFLAGDMMTGRGIDQVLSHSVDPVLFESYIRNAKQYVRLAECQSGSIPETISYSYLWGSALPELEKTNPDISIINLETAITTHDEAWPLKQIHYRMHPRNTPLFNKAGIDVCVLGNNHILDWSEDGLRQTLQVLSRHGLDTCGAGLNHDLAKIPAKADTGRGRLLVFSYATPGAGTPKTWRAEHHKPGVNFLKNLNVMGTRQVANDVESFRRKNDRIVVSLHWGSNWGYEVPRSHQKFARRLIDNGIADVIYGHSSHHPRPVEVYNNRPVFYGCGDLINDYEGISGHEEYRGELSLMYFPTLDSTGSLISLRMVPVKSIAFS